MRQSNSRGNRYEQSNRNARDFGSRRDRNDRSRGMDWRPEPHDYETEYRTSSRDMDRDRDYRQESYGRDENRGYRSSEGGYGESRREEMGSGYRPQHGEGYYGSSYGSQGMSSGIGYGNSYGNSYEQDRDMSSRRFGSSGSPYGSYYRDREYTDLESRRFDSDSRRMDDMDRSDRDRSDRSDWSDRFDRSERSERSLGSSDRSRENRYGSSEFSERRDASGRFEGRGPKGFKRTDERVKEEVCEMLTRDPSIDAEGIEVEVKEGEVTLTGTIPERRMKHLAEECAERCFGVKEVTNNLRVKREGQSETSDSTSRSSSASSPSMGQSSSARKSSSSTTSSSNTLSS